VISGEAGVAFFHSGSAGQFLNSEFRVDEAKLFVDAQVFDNIYFFTELNLTQRESQNESISFGELYLDVENLSRLWGKDNQLNLRVGRLDVPFGEEYLVRDVIDNPLIAHSLADFWGVDEGVELHGTFGKVSYVFAVQNGGHPTLRDYNSDKAIVGRLSFDPTQWLHFSVSGMRTGDLDVQDDMLSELWFGGGFFRALGNPATTTTFHANLFQADIALQLPRGHLKLAGGGARYDDNDTTADNHRNIWFYSTEGLVNVTEKFYTAARFSHIVVPDGYPLVGVGDFGNYFYTELTRNLWRLSFGGRLSVQSQSCRQTRIHF